MIPQHNLFIFRVVAALTFWFTLSFTGVPRLVDSWFVEQGPWVWISVLFWAHLPVILFLYIKDFKYTNWILLSVLLVWGYIQFDSHWTWFFEQPSEQKLTSYYRTFDFWYILPRPEGRIVPDAYHTVLHALILGTFGAWIRQLVVKRS